MPFCKSKSGRQAKLQRSGKESCKRMRKQSFINHITKHCLTYGLLGAALVMLAIAKLDVTLTFVFDSVSKLLENERLTVIACIGAATIYIIILFILLLPFIYALIWLFDGSEKVIERKINERRKRKWQTVSPAPSAEKTSTGAKLLRTNALQKRKK